MSVQEFTGELDPPKVVEFTGQLDPVPEVPGLSGRVATPSPPLDMEFVKQAFTGAPQRFTQQVASLPGFLADKWKQLPPQDQAVLMATAGSLFAPEYVVAKQTAQSLGPALTTVAQQLPRIAGAGFGGFAGRTGGELTQGSDFPTAVERGLGSAGEMAAWETTGAMAGPLLQKIPFQRIIAPFTKSMSPELKAAQEFAQSKRIPMTPSAYRPGSWVGKALESVTDAFLPSRLLKDEVYRKRALVRFNQLAAEEIPEMIGKVKPSEVVNSNAVREFGKIYDDLEKGSRGLRNEFLDDVGRTTEVAASKTKAVYEKILRTADDASLRNHAQLKLASLFEGGKVRAEDLDRAYTQIGKLKPKTDLDLLSEVKNAIKADFSDAGAPIQKFTEANEAFRKKFGLFAGKARQIEAALKKGGEIPSLTRDLFRSGDPALAKYARDNMSPEVFQDLLTENLSILLRDSALNAGKGAGLKMSTQLPDQLIFDGDKLKRYIELNRKVMEAVYPKSVMDALENFATLTKLASKDIGQLEKGMDPFNKMLQMGGLGGAGYGDLTTAVFGTAGASGLAKSLMNESGFLHKWLTSGPKATTRELVGEVLRIGGRPVFADDED